MTAEVPTEPDIKKLSGFMHDIGACLTTWSPGRAVIELDVARMHHNPMGVVHGGIMAALIDTAGAHAGIHCTVAGNIRQAMTVSINVNLVGNVTQGRLTADARLRKAGKTIFVSSCDINDDSGNLLATGEVIGRYGRGSHRPEGIPADQSVQTPVAGDTDSRS